MYQYLSIGPSIVEELYLDVPTERDRLRESEVDNGVRLSQVLVDFRCVNSYVVEPNYKRWDWGKKQKSHDQRVWSHDQSVWSHDQNIWSHAQWLASEVTRLVPRPHPQERKNYWGISWLCWFDSLNVWYTESDRSIFHQRPDIIQVIAISLNFGHPLENTGYLQVHVWKWKAQHSHPTLRVGYKNVVSHDSQLGHMTT